MSEKQPNPEEAAAGHGSRAAETGTLDAVIVGAGFSGLYMLHRLRGMGLSVLVFEARRDTPSLPAVPAGKVAAAIGIMRGIRSRLQDVELDHGVPPSRDLDLGFAWAAYRWADGQSLDRVLAGAEQAGTELSGGDFVRWMRQLIDLLDQVAKVADDAVASVARSAVGKVRRGVVAVAVGG